MTASEQPLSIVLADDHPVVLQGVAGILRAQPDMNVVAVCSEGLAAASAIRQFMPDIAVLDIAMPGLNGLHVLSSVAAAGCTTKIVFLTASATDQQIVAAISGGAHGIMLKDAAPDGLVECIRKVAAGEQWFPADLVEAALERESARRAESDRLVQALTARERQIVSLISDGLSNKELARRLDLTEGTVKVHLHNIYNKLGVQNRTILAALATAHRDELRS
jgi:DNA-binding NarL/FixJ family response regulator